MEIEEAIKICEDFIEENKDRKIILHTAIQTVLRELKNSISKEIIREKINERQFELQQQYKDFKDDIRLNTLQEIYYLNESEK